MIFRCFLLSIFISATVYSQKCLKLSYISPTGELGFTHKRGVGLEFIQMDEFEGLFRTRYGVSLQFLVPREKKFPVVTYQEEYGHTTIIPTYQSFRFYTPLQFHFGCDMEIAGSGAYFGLDLPLGLLLTSYRAGNEDFTGGLFMIGLRPHIGYERPVSKNNTLFAEISRTYSVIFQFGAVNQTELTLGIRF